MMMRLMSSSSISRRKLTAIEAAAAEAAAIPRPEELEKLRPTRLGKYLPTTNPHWYIEQIKATNKLVNRAFSKQQLFDLIRETEPNFIRIKSETTKQKLIKHILYSQWKLTNPSEIKVDPSFESLLKNFKSKQQSYLLNYHELFLLRLSEQKVIDQIADKTNVKINLDIDNSHLTIHGQMKDRAKFWTEFEKQRKPVYCIKIHVSEFKFPDLILNQLAKIAHCSLEQKVNGLKITLVAHAFDQQLELVKERVEKVINEYWKLSKEYDQIPILIDLEKQKSTRIGFIPFSYPHDLNYPNNLNFNQANFCRLMTDNTHLSSVDHNIQIDKLLDSKFLVLDQSSTNSMRFKDYLSTIITPESTTNTRTEYKVYEGHYVKSKDPKSPLLAHSLSLKSNDQGQFIRQVVLFWFDHQKSNQKPNQEQNEKLNQKSNQKGKLNQNQKGKQNQSLSVPESPESASGSGSGPGLRLPTYTFLKSIRDPIRIENPERPEELNDKRTVRMDQEEEEIVQDKSIPEHYMDQSIDALDLLVGSGVKQECIKRIVILRPNQATDLMVQVLKTHNGRS
ncbi:hypothetical protein H4Q26_004928 [Puccinia striiformis f. sp. tritici PST-130]|nr:hypothetical protein Pst134EB_008099 [Puccinia striiformis f. sp. tritici]KAI9608741.1 hypothetical protein H4Q26_004928 [Puccinia striiformis f. sp. tritici PST-130]